MKAKHQRLVLLGLAIGAVLAAVLLAMSAIRDQASYFYAPADVQRLGLPLGESVRIGGMVRAGSVRREPDGVTTSFIVGDESSATIQARFSGVLPDLFKENSGVVAEGRFHPDGQFVASEVLARHDETYKPPAMDGDRHKAESLR